MFSRLPFCGLFSVGQRLALAFSPDAVCWRKVRGRALFQGEMLPSRQGRLDRSRDEYLGTAVCVTCHDSNANFRDSAMAHAATHAPDAESLQHDPLSFQIGPCRYRITDTSGKKILRISKGGVSHSAVLLWAFGMGRIAQTYVYAQNGKFYESHLSFFTVLQGLDITPGHPRSEPPNLEEGAGRLIPDSELHDRVEHQEWIQRNHPAFRRDLRSLSRARRQTCGGDKLGRLRARGEFDYEPRKTESSRLGRLLRRVPPYLDRKSVV